MSTFILESDPDTTYPAIRFGLPWNGFDTPVIDRATLKAILDSTGEEHRWDGDAVWVGEDEKPFLPGEDGLYDTAFLGWAFLASST